LYQIGQIKIPCTKSAKLKFLNPTSYSQNRFIPSFSRTECQKSSRGRGALPENKLSRACRVPD
jgi:hypothetical protein